MSSALRQHELEDVRAIHARLGAEDPGFDADGTLRKRIARIEIDIRALELTELRLLTVLAAGGTPGAESSVLKLCSVEIEQRTHELGVQLIGHHALVFQDTPHTGVPAPLAVPEYAGALVGRYLNGRAASIFGGSQEVQRNIIAKAVLGL